VDQSLTVPDKHVSFADIQPIPQLIRTGQNRNVRSSLSGIVNSTENIKSIQEWNDQKKKQTKNVKKPQMSESALRKNKHSTVKKTATQTASVNTLNTLSKNSGKTVTGLGPKSKKSENSQLTDENLDDERKKNSENYCSHCQGYYFDDESDDEDWMNCVTCKKWFHDSCSGTFVGRNVNKSLCTGCRNAESAVGQ